MEPSYFQEVAVKKFLDQELTGESLEEFKSEVYPFLSNIGLFPWFFREILKITIHGITIISWMSF